MNDQRRQKKVGQLVKAALSRPISDLVQATFPCIITITRIHMTADLKQAHVYISLYGEVEPQTIIEWLEEKRGLLRKSIASSTKLKYNPMLFFSIDPMLEQEAAIDKILNHINKNEKI